MYRPEYRPPRGGRVQRTLVFPAQNWSDSNHWRGSYPGLSLAQETPFRITTKRRARSVGVLSALGPAWFQEGKNMNCSYGSQLAFTQAFFKRRECFKKPESDPPACGLHQAHLFVSEALVERDAPYLGKTPCYICPATGSVVVGSLGIREPVPPGEES